ncbi:L,D-transpeptidase [Streptomyces sp. NPDC057445]|uniref:L,D-transpeptidase n=1 Tax=Streptomyces sp. NPDC057445 TaxID=3346136 RepID=UPI0036BD8DCD
MARSSSGIVAGLTTTALVVVAFLAYQASANVPEHLKGPAAAAETPAPRPSGDTDAETRKDPLAVPARSGRGMRVVYSLSERRVWLVDGAGRASRTFEVMPSTVSPPAGSYAVTSRSGSIRGSDGVPIEHVVRFATVDDVNIGFSAAVDGSVTAPARGRKTGGVRMTRTDGDALWTFATIGTKVVVLP